MKSVTPPIAILALAISVAMLNPPGSEQKSEHLPTTSLHRSPKASSSKIQAAILLDVSGSMSGLIEQAKAQLWNMVSTMGKATCNGETPQIEIALYEYGRPDNGINNGYIKQISGFTTDLDRLSQELFVLTTDGGDEYCGQVIFKSLDELNWDTANASYKVIFIAGNEDFLQGNIHFTKSCKQAKERGVIVNTIYCGDRMQGIREHWNLQGECGNGSYTNINHNAAIEEIPTPYDSLMLTLNDELNGTYISYGYAGKDASMAQVKLDKMNYGVSKSVAVKRAEVKSKKQLYKNTHWDVVDAANDDSKFLEKVDMKTLPDSLQNKDRESLKKIVAVKKQQRDTIQVKIGKLAVEREKYIANVKAKKAGQAQQATLETEIEKIIRKQAKLYNMIIP